MWGLDRVVDFLENVFRVQANNNGLNPDAVTPPDWAYSFRKDRKLNKSELTYDQIRAIGHLEIASRLYSMLDEERENLPYTAFLDAARRELYGLRDKEPKSTIIDMMKLVSELAQADALGEQQKVKALTESIAAHALQVRNRNIGIKRSSMDGKGKLAIA